MELHHGTAGRHDRFWDNVHIGAILLIFCCYLFFILSPIHDYKIAHALLNPLAVALTAVSLVRFRGKFPWVMLPSFGFVLWYYGVQALHGNYYLLTTYSDDRLAAMLMVWVLFFGTPLILSPALRQKTADALAHIMVLFFGLLSWLGAIGCFTASPFKSPFTDLALYYDENGRLAFFQLHPNFASAMVFVALCCGVYLFLRTKCKWRKWYYGLMMLGMCLAIFLAESRTIFLSISLAGGLLAFLLCLRSKLPQVKRFWAGLLAMLFVALLIFGLFLGMPALMKQLAPPRAVAMEEAPVSPETFVLPEDARGNFFEELSTMTRRTEIFRSLWEAIRLSPDILWRGAMPETAMNLPREIMGRADVVHMHNSLLQTLLLTGLPGLFLSLLFTAMLAVYALRLFFADPKVVSLSDQFWILPVAGLLLCSISEPYLYVENCLPNLLFFFSAGMVIARARELPPLFRRKAKS